MSTGDEARASVNAASSQRDRAIATAEAHWHQLKGWFGELSKEFASEGHRSLLARNASVRPSRSALLGGCSAGRRPVADPYRSVAGRVWRDPMQHKLVVRSWSVADVFDDLVRPVLRQGSHSVEPGYHEVVGGKVTNEKVLVFDMPEPTFSARIHLRDE